MKCSCTALDNSRADCDSPCGSRKPILLPKTRAHVASSPKRLAIDSKFVILPSSVLVCFRMLHQSSAISSTCGRKLDIVRGLVSSVVRDVRRKCQISPEMIFLINGIVKCGTIVKEC